MLYSVDFVQNFKSKKIGQSSTIQLSMCEELLCVFWHYSIIHVWGTLMCLLALLNYPCVRNSYVHFVFTLLCIDNQHMFYIQQMTIHFWHGMFMMTYNAPLISSWWHLCDSSILVKMNMLHLTDLVIWANFSFEIASYLPKVYRLLETLHDFQMDDYFMYIETSCG